MKTSIIFPLCAIWLFANLAGCSKIDNPPPSLAPDELIESTGHFKHHPFILKDLIDLDIKALETLLAENGYQIKKRSNHFTKQYHIDALHPDGSHFNIPYDKESGAIAQISMSIAPYPNQTLEQSQDREETYHSLIAYHQLSETSSEYRLQQFNPKQLNQSSDQAVVGMRLYSATSRTPVRR